MGGEGAQRSYRLVQLRRDEESTRSSGETMVYYRHTRRQGTWAQVWRWLAERSQQEQGGGAKMSVARSDRFSRGGADDYLPRREVHADDVGRCDHNAVAAARVQFRRAHRPHSHHHLRGRTCRVSRPALWEGPGHLAEPRGRERTCTLLLCLPPSLRPVLKSLTDPFSLSSSVAIALLVPCIPLATPKLAPRCDIAGVFILIIAS